MGRATSPGQPVPTYWARIAAKLLKRDGGRGLMELDYSESEMVD